MPFIDKLNQFAAAKAKLAEMEQSITAERTSALANLPSEFGYSDLNGFIKALKDAQQFVGRRKVRAKKAAPKVTKRTRAKITDETKADVKNMVEARRGLRLPRR